jgi:hypothetical protein
LPLLLDNHGSVDGDGTLPAWLPEHIFAAPAVAEFPSIGRSRL